MLTIEYDPENVLEVSLDASGRDELVRVLTALQAGDHEHLFTPAWGGFPLTEDFQHPDLVPIHQVTIQMVD